MGMAFILRIKFSNTYIDSDHNDTNILCTCIFVKKIKIELFIAFTIKKKVVNFFK